MLTVANCFLTCDRSLLITYTLELLNIYSVVICVIF